MSYGLNYDAALLQLERPAIPSNSVSVACLPGKDEKWEEYTGKICSSVGWGVTEQKNGIYKSILLLKLFI